jgi:lipid-A-disaccharide synthase
MKYYLIAGEASGDLHASALMAALRNEDSEAEFRFFGGDEMCKVGGTLVKHFKDLAFMGFIPVLLHLRTIFAGMKLCKTDILAWQPDVVILVDYPGFNLSIAKFVHCHTHIPVYYYISPKIWAWKEYRIKNIKKYVNELFSILPFEVPFFEQKHHYPIHYVGNPTMDEVTLFKATHPAGAARFAQQNALDARPIVALLAGSRQQEIRDNLPVMIEALKPFYADFQLVLAGAPSIDRSYYDQFLKDTPVHLVFGQTYPLLQHSRMALVTSGTATLETALFGVPQVVCYYLNFGKLFSFLRRHLLKVPYISLVNLIAAKEVVPELVADGMTVDSLRRTLQPLLADGAERQQMLDGYAEVSRRLGDAGAPQRAAHEMVRLLR